MRQEIKYILFILALLIPTIASWGKTDIRFTANAERTVIAGEPFRLQFQVNESGKNFELPSLNGFDVLSGPQTSTSSSTQIINGKITRSKSTIYTYILMAEKEGEYTIPAATITVGKEKYHSNTLNIKVLPPDETAGNDPTERRGGVARSTNISSDNLFVKAIASKTNVYEQEAILLTYKLFFRVDLTNISPIEFPDFKGFLVQEIELPQDRRPQVEHYNGINYNTYEIRKILLFPQHKGKLKIDAAKINTIVRIPVQQIQRSFFDSFFEQFQEVEKIISTGVLNINVEQLPQPKPADFSGIVGSLSLESDITSKEVNTNEPITLTLEISGSGNLKMLKNPELQLPTDFESYEPKTNNNFKTGNKGLSGSKEIEYLFIPRHDGNFTIPSTSFSYFDPETKKYRTINTPTYNIKVNKGVGNDQTPVVVNNFTNSEKVTVTATDIRFINTQPLRLNKENRLIAGTPLYWMLFIIPLIVAVTLALFFRKQIKESADIALMRNKKANKVARKRLVAADKYAKANDREHFYDEILKALWGYLSDKLGIPVADLNKDNIISNLMTHNVSRETIDKFMEILNDCEYERYAPSSDSKAVMEKVYGTTMTLISALEGAVKRKKVTK